MKTNLKLLVLLFWLPYTLCALDSLNVRLLNYAIEHPPQEEQSVGEVAKLLSTAANSDFERAEIAAYWITEHFDYDVQGEQVTASDDLDVNAVLRLRKGNVRTFSQLYLELCKAMDVEAYLIPGYFKSVSQYVPDEYYDGEYLDLPERPYHTWVGVKVGGTYLFVDISIGMGQLVGDFGNFTFERERDIKMLLVPSEQFNITHLPADPLWQLLEQPIAIQHFFRRLLYADKVTKPPYAEAFAAEDLLSRYEKASAAERRLQQLRRTAAFHPVEFNIRQAADALYNMGYTLSLEAFSTKRMIAARKYYRQAIATYRQLERDDEIEALLRQVEQGITYVEYRLENKQ